MLNSVPSIIIEIGERVNTSLRFLRNISRKFIVHNCIFDIIKFINPKFQDKNNMNDNQELLLIDTPPSSPLRHRDPSEEQNLLQDLSSKEFIKHPDVQLGAEKEPFVASETWSSTRYWSQQNTFFWQQQLQEDDDDERDTTVIIQEQKKADSSTEKPQFPYYNLMKKLEKVYQQIEQKQKSDRKALFSSAIQVKLSSSHQTSKEKALKTQRNSKATYTQVNKRKQSWAIARKSATEPDQDRKNSKTIYSPRKKMESYTIKAINEVEEKDSPRKVEKHRTRQEFLASITNWQERRKLKHEQLIKKQHALSMTGVTFTPQINAKSKLLMKKKGSQLPIYQRDMKSKKLQNQLPKQTIKLKK